MMNIKYEKVIAWKSKLKIYLKLISKEEKSCQNIMYKLTPHNHWNDESDDEDGEDVVVAAGAAQDEHHHHDANETEI